MSNQLFLPQLWANEIAKKFTDSVTLGGLYNTVVFWGDRVPDDEEDLDAGSFLKFQACIFGEANEVHV